MTDFGPLFFQTIPNNLTNGERVFKPATKTAAPEKISDYGIHIGGARKEQDITYRTNTATKAKTESLPFWLPKKYIITDIASLRTYEKQLDFRLQIGSGEYCIVSRRKRSYDRVIRWGYDGREQAVNDLPSVFVKDIVFVGHNKEDNSYYLYKTIKTTNGRLKIKSGFSSKEEAEQYRIDNALALLEFKFKAPELPHLSKIIRKGSDYRNGRDISVQDLCDTFGFPGVEFGNWLTQKERQTVLNHAYDAFMDLCNVTGLPYRAMSFNGLLAAAFGSRGIANALAHFEPGRFVFNLSRLKGAGSLAHEWFHALDNFVGASAEGIRLERNVSGILNCGKNNYATTMNTTACRDDWKDIVNEFKVLADTMRSRLAEVDFVESGEIMEYQKQLDRYYSILDRHAVTILNELKADRSYRSKGGYPATPEQLAQAEILLKEIREGRQGAECVHPNKARFQSAWFYRSYEKVEELAKIVKAVRNREFFGENAMLSEYSNTVYWILNQKKLIEEKLEQGKGIRRINTNYLKESRHIDSYRATPYWATTIEMAARAFGAFVQDSIEEKGGSSPYLVHSHTNNANDFRPYPEGNERRAINKQFRALFKKLQNAI